MSSIKESHADALIIGAGPAGLMMAAWMAKCGVNARIVDKRNTKDFNGQADGLQCRTLGDYGLTGLRPPRMADRMADTTPGLSRFQQAVLHQGRIERFFLDEIEDCSSIRVERGVMPTSLTIDEAAVEDQAAYPVTVKLRHLTEEEATPKQSNLSKDNTNDLLAAGKLNEKANTEEIVHAKQCHDHRTRENKLVRVYVQLTTTAKIGDEAGSRADRSKINPETIIAEARKIMAPYKISYRTLDWWTAYQIGQRVGTQFSVHERVFLAGDAVHTHSPKAGQGMNVSMQDTFNLGWKIASVVKGLASRSILKTYQSERRKVAQDLIAFDHKFSRLFSSRPSKGDTDTEGVKLADFKDTFTKGNSFVSGTYVDYGASAIVAKAGDALVQEDGTDFIVGGERNRPISNQDSASGFLVDMRIPSVKVLRQADARPWHLQELLPSNGRWRVLVFPGNVQDQEQAAQLASVAENFNACDSFVSRFTPTRGPIDAVFEILVVHKAPRTAVTIFDFPSIFRRFSETEGYDYDKIYVDDVSYHEGHGSINQKFGITEGGCIVIVRPDQHVSSVGSLREPAAVTQFFSGFMIPQI